MQFSFQLDLRYVLHSKENADLVCSSQLSVTCEFPVALGQSAYVLLTSPTVNLVLNCALNIDSLIMEIVVLYSLVCANEFEFLNFSVKMRENNLLNARKKTAQLNWKLNKE